MMRNTSINCANFNNNVSLRVKRSNLVQNHTEKEIATSSGLAEPI